VSIVNVDTLGGIKPLLAGNLCALAVSAFLAVAISMAAPQNYDWEELRRQTDAFLVEADSHAHLDASGAESKEAMDTAYKYTVIGAGIMTLVLIFLWPALALPAATFSKVMHSQDAWYFADKFGECANTLLKLIVCFEYTELLYLLGCYCFYLGTRGLRHHW